MIELMMGDYILLAGLGAVGVLCIRHSRREWKASECRWKAIEERRELREAMLDRAVEKARDDVGGD